MKKRIKEFFASRLNAAILCTGIIGIVAIVWLAIKVVSDNKKFAALTLALAAATNQPPARAEVDTQTLLSNLSARAKQFASPRSNAVPSGAMHTSASRLPFPAEIPSPEKRATNASTRVDATAGNASSLQLSAPTAPADPDPLVRAEQVRREFAAGPQPSASTSTSAPPASALVPSELEALKAELKARDEKVERLLKLHEETKRERATTPTPVVGGAPLSAPLAPLPLQQSPSGIVVSNTTTSITIINNNTLNAGDSARQSATPTGQTQVTGDSSGSGSSQVVTNKVPAVPAVKKTKADNSVPIFHAPQVASANTNVFDYTHQGLAPATPEEREAASKHLFGETRSVWDGPAGSQQAPPTQAQYAAAPSAAPVQEKTVPYYQMEVSQPVMYNVQPTYAGSIPGYVMSYGPDGYAATSFGVGASAGVYLGTVPGYHTVRVYQSRPVNVAVNIGGGTGGPHRGGGGHRR